MYRQVLALLRSLVSNQLNLVEHLRRWCMKRSGAIIPISDLIPKFSGSTFFAFATGASLANIQEVEKVKNHNVLMLTTAPVHFFQMHGVMPNLWLIHNPSSVRMAIKAIDSYGLRGKIDFSNTYILVPDNSSISKTHFSDSSMRKLRKAIGKTTYVLYSEKIYVRTHTAEDFASGNAVPNNYLRQGFEPIELMHGSSVEAVLLPFLSYLGVREIYFGGVDHQDTGHFWDPNDPWQNEDGTPKSFGDAGLVHASNIAALKVAKSKEISVYRLEAEMTALKAYDHIEFEEALSRSSERAEMD